MMHEKYFDRDQESFKGIEPSEFMGYIKPKTQQAITFNGIEERLKNNSNLNVKFGTDPTGPELHLGHIVPIRALDLFRKSGHNIDLIFGDFTAQIGDPTERDSSRVALTNAQILDNMSTFDKQVDRYFPIYSENVRIHRNSQWLGRMALKDLFADLQVINLNEALQRNDFRQRIEKGQTVSVAELIYGSLMGIDSAHLETDIEIGGIDQLLNFQQARAIQRGRGQKAEEIIMTPIIEGTSGDGRKMSKSYGNYIAANAEVDDIFGKIMSIPDNLILPYTVAFAHVHEKEIPDLEIARNRDPLEFKKQLGQYMIALVTKSLDQSQETREKFERRFRDKEFNKDDAKKLFLDSSQSIVDALISTGDFKSKSEVRRLIEQGGIKIDGKKVIDIQHTLEPNNGLSILVAGKRKLYSF